MRPLLLPGLACSEGSAGAVGALSRVLGVSCHHVASSARILGNCASAPGAHQQTHALHSFSGASTPQRVSSCVTGCGRCSCCTGPNTSTADNRQLAMRPSATGFQTFASSACTVRSSTSHRVYCASACDGSSNGADRGESSVGHTHGGIAPGATPLAAIQPRIVMVFTCTKCDTRSTKAFSKQSYQKGVVLVRCPGCKNLHLVADHLGWFGEEPFVLHEHVTQLGGNVVRIAADDPRSDEAAAAASTATAGSQKRAQQQATAATGAGGDPADPGLAARTAAAVAVAESSEGGLFELSDESQVRAALAEAKELKDQRSHSQRH